MIVNGRVRDEYDDLNASPDWWEYLLDDNGIFIDGWDSYEQNYNGFQERMRHARLSIP